MKNKIIMMMFAIFLLASIINVSAIEYYQVKSFQGNQTTRSHTLLIADTSGLVSDHIKSGNPFQAYFLYTIYVQKWNTDNPDYAVQNCNMTIRFLDSLDNSSDIIFNRVFTGVEEDTINAKYFVELYTSDLVTATIDCLFSGTRPDDLDMPITISTVAPTWECKACQYYEWSVLEQDIVKAQTIGSNTIEVMEFIKGVVLLNFEIIIAIFWIILIIAGLTATSLIFIGVYWLFLWFRSIGRGIK
jgi:hypothetical protein